ncbi:hypothetical protein GOARA_025_00090 [Gordonia araii NBRC 100433]|uniref:Uncharacterized protein n=1 Tax=Gordonia araii NBRC 100433 TaxID=1073574 RepID=G7GZD8_9ACTN|nr:hypothetical protein [Gordonia araii]NNG98908.1 hypothetical protein [Gordonia araii NBRC 100433]GAB08963.1 hypothetical protein GOARA_025_00090 [Gordonia araii NBRC 100433]
MPEPTLLSEAEAWLERAKVARWAAEELVACINAVSGVLAANYMGDGCTEAPPVFAELKRDLAAGSPSWNFSLAQQADSLKGLANTCAGAGDSFRTFDRIGAHLIEK